MACRDDRAPCDGSLLSVSHVTAGILSGVLMVGLTGGIGSGKSAVAHRLAELGAVVIDADTLAREVVAPGTEGLAAVVAAFGPQVLTADGAMDRAKVAALVFGDEDKRRQLEAVIHPRVRERSIRM